MKKVYIVSLVFTRVIPQQGIINGSSHKAAAPDISIQNEVGICHADSPDEAYEKISRTARLKYPGHHIAVKVVIETTEYDLNING